MYTFSTQNQIGQKVEQAFETLLTAAGIPWGKNPYTGTADPRRADYDHWLFSPDGILTEEKGNPAAANTGNVALEEDILDHSKAHYFLIAFPVSTGWHGRVLLSYEIEKLLHATTIRNGYRQYTYKRVPAGQYHRPSALIPTSELPGVPVTEFINQLSKAG